MFNYLKLNEMKKFLYSFFTLAIALMIVNCSGSGANSPSNIEKSLYTQLQKGDYAKSAELLIKNLDSDKVTTPEQQEQFVKLFGEKAKQSTESKGGIKSFEIVEEKIADDGLSATVSTKVIFKDGSEKTETTKYVKKDSSWKISINK